MFEPDVFLHDQSSNQVTVTKITRYKPNCLILNENRLFRFRLCSGDQTVDLASKISVLVGCDQESELDFFLIDFYSVSAARNISSHGEAAVYDNENGQLNVMMFNQTSMGHVMCRFKLSNLEKRFSTIWNTCQEVSFNEIVAKENKCKYPSIFDVMRKKKGCLIYSRLDDTASPTLCARFGVRPWWIKQDH